MRIADLKMTKKEKLIQAFSAGLGIPASTEMTTFEYRRIAQWNSMAHMQLVLEIESAFDIMLDTEEVLGLSSFEKALEIVSSHGVDVAS
jgi:acyl carrier protein